ncbi:MAG: ATP-grasp domain-containing protein [Phycisphaerales bacterium]|nr:ATP-grasp domain-containing protein [Phycisphaerales bacterium]
MSKRSKKFRVVALMHEDFIPPEDLSGMSDREVAMLRTEYDVVTALEDLGHDVTILGVSDDIAPIRKTVVEKKPHIIFNLLEEFRGKGIYVPYVLGFLELMGSAYTGCNPSSLILATRKVTAKKILRYHRIATPAFVVFHRGKRVQRPAKLPFPLIVKSTMEHGSVGIAQASVVTSDEKLADRVAYVHEQVGTDAIAEQFITGRELYVGMIGNHRVQTFPLWEMHFDKVADGVHRIASESVKWNASYRKRHGITTGEAGDLPEGAADRIIHICKRVYRLLGLNGYARMDLRLADNGTVYLLEPNPNPDLAHDDDFSLSAQSGGMTYEELIQKLIGLGRRYRAND